MNRIYYFRQQYSRTCDERTPLGPAKSVPTLQVACHDRCILVEMTDKGTSKCVLSREVSSQGPHMAGTTVTFCSSPPFLSSKMARFGPLKQSTVEPPFINLQKSGKMWSY
ncbi:hypothetical protein V1264_000870 [Littorina saxatilis]|uniref:Uncharacterized protein n=1 Tax=Littorina saxatilis TaxID=31220 RepID=A0AAN9GNJ6_9CAEN